MALIATRDFYRVSSKRIGEIVNSCNDNLQIKVHTLKGGRYVYEFPQRRCVWGLSVKQLRHSLNIYCSYFVLTNSGYWIFRHPFLRHLAFPYFLSDSIETVYGNSKRVEVVWYGVLCGYPALIQIYDLLNVVPFFGLHDIRRHWKILKALIISIIWI